MMKKLLILLVLLISLDLGAQTILPNDYRTLEIKGEMNYLSIKGGTDNETRITINPTNGEKLFKIKEKNNKLILDFDAKKIDVFIELPHAKDIEINPNDIVFEGIFDLKKDRRKIDISDMTGTIAVSTDGYEVNLHRNTNDMNVVSYFDIIADSIWVKKEGSILLDSYFGDVYLRTLNPLDASINLRANLGEVIIDSLIDLSEKYVLLSDKISVITGEGLSDIILHSEKGDSVWFDSIKFPDSSFYKEIEQLNVFYEKMQEDYELMQEDFKTMEFPEMPILSDFPSISNMPINSDFPASSNMPIKSEKPLLSSNLDLEKELLTERFTMKQNEPNPWRKETTVEYILPHDGEIVFKIYNRWGEVLYEVSQNGKKGSNKLKIHNKMVKEFGVFIYSITFENETLSNMMTRA